MKYFSFVYIAFISILLVFITGCKKFIDVSAPGNATTNVFGANETAIGVMTTVYTKMSQSAPTQGPTYFPSLVLGIYSDEFFLYKAGLSNATYGNYYKNSLSKDISLTIDLWNNYYQLIYIANSVLEGVAVSSMLHPDVKKRLFGEAKFMRAFSYFHLVSLYGSAPLVISTDYEVNSTLPRSDSATIWAMIIKDLKAADSTLSETYLNGDLLKPTEERIRPNKWAAKALLARSYLYMKDYRNAEAYSSSLIANTSQFNLETLENTFLKDSKEAIWQLKPVNEGYNTEESKNFVLTGAPNFLRPVALSSNLVNAFEPNDARMVNWVGKVTVGATQYFYPKKYKVNQSGNPVSEYAIVLRLAEQYLVRSEARLYMNEIALARADLNEVRKRAKLDSITTTNVDSLRNAIIHERNIELFSEWGHRWFDLKRYGIVDSVMAVATPAKVAGSEWKPYKKYFPLSRTQMDRNPFLVQTPGYN